MRILITAVAATLLLAGCVKTNKNGEQEVNVLGAKMEMGKSLPTDAPPYVKVYPGVEQVMKMKVAGMSVVAFEAPAKVDDIIAYYRTQATADGLTEGPAPVQAGAPPGQKTIAFGDPASDKMLIVMARPQNEAAMVSITYKPLKTPS